MAADAFRICGWRHTTQWDGRLFAVCCSHSVRADVCWFESVELGFAGAAGVLDGDVCREQSAGAGAQSVAADDFFAGVVDQRVTINENIADLGVLV